MWLTSLLSNVSPIVDKSEKTRKMGFSDSFYPSDKGELDKMLAKLYRQYKRIKYYEDVNAIIIPHAGYDYSASVAVSAIGRIDPVKKYDRIFIIGPSHNLYIDGASVDGCYEYYDTPYGKVQVDSALCGKLIKCNSCFCYRQGAHIDEHCIHVELPLLKYYLKNMAPIIPIVVGTDSIHLIMSIADALQPYFDGSSLFVISSDFSHYPSYDDALKIDSLTASAIMKCSMDDFMDAIIANSKLSIPNFITCACGKSAISILLYMASKYNDVKVTHTAYKNSGDALERNRDKVVGYHSFVFTRDSCQFSQPLLRLSPQDKKTLLSIARNSIEKRLLLARAISIDELKLSDSLKRRCGVFVTLIKNGKLRGCLGHFGYDISIFQNVIEMSQASAFEDPRFHPILPEEMEYVNIEISVIAPMRRIYDLNEFTMGKHGIFMKKDGRSGTFLPQVAYEVKWDKEEFISHCAHDKLGLGWDGWKDAELYVYEAIVFREFSTSNIS